MGVYDKLKRMRKEHGLTQKEAGEIIGAATSTYADLEKAKIKIKAEDLKAFADFYGVDIRSFFTNEEIHGVNKINTTPISLESEVVKIPVLGYVPAGIPIEAIENILDYEEIPKSLAQTGTFFAFKISGDSMYPRYLDGDIIICKQQDFVKNGGEAIVYVNSDYETTFKRIIFKENEVELESYNQMYPTMKIKKELLNVLAVPVELRRKMI